MTRLREILSWMFLASIVTSIALLLFCDLQTARMAQFPMLALWATCRFLRKRESRTAI